MEARARFPRLTLAPIEHYFVADDHPDNPMTFAFRLRFRGRLDRLRFGAALGATLEGHPLLQARLEGSRRGATARLSWVDAGRNGPFVSWEPEGVPLEYPAGIAFDLDAGTGLRLWVRQGDDRATVVAQFHHACCDGIGALEFLEALLGAYGGSRDAEPSPPRGAEWRLLRRRGRFGPGQGGRLRGLAWDLARAGRFFAAGPARRATARAVPEPGDAPARDPVGISHTLSEPETSRLVARARQRGVTVNDLLVRDLFVTLQRWDAHRGHRPRGPIRLAIPINMRTAPDRNGPAMNRMSIAFLDRHPAQIADPERLLDSLHDEMKAVKRGRAGLIPLRVFRAAGAVRGGLASLVECRFNRISSTLSNLGVVLAASPLRSPTGRLDLGGVVLDSIEGWTPIQRGSAGSFMVLTYAGRLTIGLAVDHRMLTENDGRGLLDLFAAEVVRSSR